MCVSRGRTRAISGMAQVPFNASMAVQLHASLDLGLVAAGAPVSRHVVGVVADIPLRLRAPFTQEQLTLELKSDRQLACFADYRCCERTATHAWVAVRRGRYDAPLHLPWQRSLLSPVPFATDVTMILQGRDSDRYLQSPLPSAPR
jgi:hypothetical protein